MKSKFCCRLLVSSAVSALLISNVGIATAAPVTTADVLAAEELRIQRDQLREMLAREDVRALLLKQGVLPRQVEERIARLTPAEIALMNEKFDEMQAAGDAGGVILTVLLVFLVTDILCVTDIYPFINCIDKS